MNAQRKADSDAAQDVEARAVAAARRIARIGVPKQELARLAGVDRGTLGRALKADPRIEDRTWVKVERALDRLEEEIGIEVRLPAAASDEIVHADVEYGGAKMTLSGKADAVAEAIRKVLEG